MAYRVIDADPDPDEVRSMTFVPFLPDGSCAVVRARTGIRLPSGEVRTGEHFLLDTSVRIPLDQAGYRMRRVHPVARDGGHLFVWLDGDRFPGRRPYGRVALVAGEPEVLADRLAESGRRVEARAVRDAVVSFSGRCTDDWFADSVRLLEPGYLRATTPEGGSGFAGSARRWRARRENVLAGVTGPGSFLDLGCANGLLMESVHAWAAERGVALEPYGVDLAPGLVALARRRLPHWSDRIELGNAVSWRPVDGRRFRYVHLLLDLVPDELRGALVRHASTLLEPGGRLLVSHYLNEGSSDEPVVRKLAELGVRSEGVDPDGQTAWLDARAASRATTSVENVKSY
ncbi:MAG: class I SAM-dependent methyltransferase [Actinocatenispora sp.]